VKVSTRGDYAARALLSMALHGYDRPTSVKEIAERTGLPQPYLEQILLAVKGAGLARSKRGVGGGYVLARPPEEITLADIVAATDGPIENCVDAHDHREGHCALQDVWVQVSERMRALLEDFTLADLVARARMGHSPELLGVVEADEDGGEVGGEGVGELDPLAGLGVDEGEELGMEKRPAQTRSE
jgi:Rrf2 family iron-sulfur cluster assembly transcriptional regulator